MTSVILACMIALPSWGGVAACGDAGGCDSRPLKIRNPYVPPIAGVDYAGCVVPNWTTVPLRIRNPFAPAASAAREEESSQYGPFACHVWGRFEAARVYPSQKE